jgi:serine/threonine protein kinase
MHGQGLLNRRGVITTFHRGKCYRKYHPLLADKFKKEMILLKLMAGHPHIQDNVEVDSSHLVMTQPRAQHGNLVRYISNPRTPKELNLALLHIALAVQALHTERVLVQNLDVTNVLVYQSGKTVKFVLSNFMPYDKHVDLMELEGAVLSGSTVYLAPEEIRAMTEFTDTGSSVTKIGMAADIFRYGLIYYILKSAGGDEKRTQRRLDTFVAYRNDTLRPMRYFTNEVFLNYYPADRLSGHLRMDDFWDDVTLTLT